MVAANAIPTYMTAKGKTTDPPPSINQVLWRASAKVGAVSNPVPTRLTEWLTQLDRFVGRSSSNQRVPPPKGNRMLPNQAAVRLRVTLRTHTQPKTSVNAMVSARLTSQADHGKKPARRTRLAAKT